MTTLLWFDLPISVVAQSPPPTTLTIDVENVVEYQGDIFDPTRFGTSPGVTPSGGSYTFASSVAVGDIVSVNGQPCSGTYIGRPLGVFLTPTPKPKQSVADVARGSLRSHTFEILKTDGTPIGTLMSFGLDGGSPPPGAPSYSVATKGNYTIFGGTGAYLGARGELVQRQQALETVPPRAASLTEDPANRRVNGGGRILFFLHLLPMSTPQIASTPQGPAVTHSSDFTLVSTSKPAAPGEVLSLFANGLGPTSPGVNPGQPFPTSPLQAVNSPVEVLVNGKSAEVLGGAGFPGAVDGYQVNFRLPPDTAKGPAAIQLSSAWIAGAPVTIAVQ
jgi:uncharacterized protein (TIGR03437 family)